ncbi:hypothetical protein [Neptunomonas concharum]|uniref:MSHA biogenesis protein MshP n=1 Tax=Neptunomonas concharum TaxID=1031538 RepID=A0A5P1RG89_9GAMM|nr:hypothetical protein [Neptunomonas concharum]QEQ98162.1 hypothetical protein F0U83_16385 [Neptunomonas concharum]
MRLDYANYPKSEQGLGLISAIFVIVVLAVLVVGMNSMLRTSQTYRAQEVLAARALLAAQSGAELHLSELLHPENPQVCNSDASPVLFTVSGLKNCSYQATCSLITLAGQDYYTIKSTGRCGSGVDSATRIVKVRVAP